MAFRTAHSHSSLGARLRGEQLENRSMLTTVVLDGLAEYFTETTAGDVMTEIESQQADCERDDRQQAPTDFTTTNVQE